MDKQQIIEDALLRTWANKRGYEKVLDKHIEELAELLTVLLQRRNKPVNKADIVTEVVDLGIMLEELIIILGITETELSQTRTRKLSKIREYIKRGVFDGV